MTDAREIEFENWWNSNPHNILPRNPYGYKSAKWHAWIAWESQLAALAAKDAEIERRGKILSDAETELYAYGYEDGALVSDSVKDLCFKAVSLQKQVNQQAAEIERSHQDCVTLTEKLIDRDKQIEQLQAMVKELEQAGADDE